MDQSCDEPDLYDTLLKNRMVYILSDAFKNDNFLRLYDNKFYFNCKNIESKHMGVICFNRNLMWRYRVNNTFGFCIFT